MRLWQDAALECNHIAGAMDSQNPTGIFARLEKLRFIHARNCLALTPPFFIMPVPILILMYLLLGHAAGFTWSFIQWLTYSRHSDRRISLLARTFFFPFYLPSLIASAGYYCTSRTVIGCLQGGALLYILYWVWSVAAPSPSELVSPWYVIFSGPQLPSLILTSACQAIFNQSHRLAGA